MIKSQYQHHIIVLIVAALFLFIGSCATPIAPTGGERDQTPPSLENTIPENGTTSFDKRKVSFVFSEFVNRNTFRQNLQIEPDIGLDYDISWKRKTATVVFKDDLPDSTTIILTVGTGLSDTQSNRLPSPIQVALSTGDKIDTGEIVGRVLDAEQGSGSDGQTILLFKEPFDFRDKADYSTQTDTAGRFTFRYLSEGRYSAFFVDDRNRNKIWDRENENAQPFPKQFANVFDEVQDTVGTLFTVRLDTLPPNLLGVGLFSGRRMRLRFSQGVGFEDSVSIQVVDSLSNEPIEAELLYGDPNDAFVVYAQAQEDLLPENRYSIQLEGFVDASGNHVTPSDDYFSGSARSDTTLQRIIGQVGEDGIFPDQSLRVLYAGPITDSFIKDSTTIIIGENSVDEFSGIEIKSNELRINPQPEWQQGVNYQFLVWNPKTQRRFAIIPKIWFPADYGEIEINSNSTDSLEFNYLLQAQNGTISETGNFTNQTILTELAPVNYKLIVYRDLNGNGVWDLGSVDPYEAPEPYFIRNPLRLAGGFTSDVTLEFD